MKRSGLHILLRVDQKGAIDTVLITHKERLARSGVELPEKILQDYGVRLEVLHECSTETDSTGGTGR